MRTHRAPTILIAVVTAVAVLAGGCSDDGGGASAQAYADAIAADLVQDPGVPVSDEAARCIGDAVVRELGVAPFHDAGVEPEDLAGDEPLGRLLGAGRVSDERAAAAAAAWDACADMTTTFAVQAKQQLGLDDAGVACFTDDLREQGTIRRYLALRLTAEDDAAVQGILDEIKGLVEGCTRETGQAALVVDAIAASITAKGSIAAADARCLAQHVVDALGVASLLSIGSAAGLVAAPVEVQRSVAQGVLDAGVACGIDVGASGSADPG